MRVRVCVFKHTYSTHQWGSICILYPDPMSGHRTRSRSRTAADSAALAADGAGLPADADGEENDDESGSDEESTERLQLEEIATLRAELARQGRDHAVALAAAEGGRGRSRHRDGSRGFIPPPPPPGRVIPPVRVVPVAATAEQEAALVAALPLRLQNLLKWCASTHGVLYTGLAKDAVVFKGRFNAVCRSFGLSHVLSHPSTRPLVVSEAVRLEENSMCMLLIQAAFINFPERLPVDMEPERPLDAWSSPVARAWYTWRYLGDSRAVLSAKDGYNAWGKFTSLRQGNEVQSLARFLAEFQECRRILAVAPDAVIPTTQMLIQQLKNGLNARCRLHVERIDFDVGDIEDWLYQLTLKNNEWLLENGHPLPGTLTLATPSGTLAGASSTDSRASSSCTWCESSKHCVDKCGQKMQWMAKGKEELHAKREAAAQAKRAARSGEGGKKNGQPKKNPKKDPRPTPPASAAKATHCYDFQRGACQRGGACKFAHVLVAAAGAGAQAAAAAPPNGGEVSAADALAIAKFMGRAEGNPALQKAFRDRVDEGWMSSARSTGSVYSKYDSEDRHVWLVDSGSDFMMTPRLEVFNPGSLDYTRTCIVTPSKKNAGFIGIALGRVTYLIRDRRDGRIYVREAEVWYSPEASGQIASFYGANDAGCEFYLTKKPWGEWTCPLTGHVVEFDLERPGRDGSNLGRLPLLRLASPLELIAQGNLMGASRSTSTLLSASTSSRRVGSALDGSSSAPSRSIVSAAVGPTSTSTSTTSFVSTVVSPTSSVAASTLSPVAVDGAKSADAEAPIFGGGPRSVEAGASVHVPESGPDANLFWCQFPALVDLVPPLASFSIGAPPNFPIGAAHLQSTQETVGDISQLTAPTAGSLFGPARPPRKPPPVFSTELSLDAVEAAHISLRSFILDANAGAGTSPTHMSLVEAHWSYGHVSYDSILSWEKSGTLRVDGVVLSDHKRVWCMRCKGANMKKPSSPSVSAHRPPDIMHTISWDIFGPTRIVGVGNIRFFNTGRDRACGFAWTRPLTYKSQAAAHCISVMRFEQLQTGLHVSVFQSDGGGEYAGPLLKQFLFVDNGTFHRVSAPYQSNDNAGIERLIGILAAMTRVLMAGCTLPSRYFVYAWIYAVLLHNVLRCATVPAGLSPFTFF